MNSLVDSALMSNCALREAIGAHAELVDMRMETPGPRRAISTHRVGVRLTDAAAGESPVVAGKGRRQLGWLLVVARGSSRGRKQNSAALGCDPRRDAESNDADSSLISAWRPRLALATLLVLVTRTGRTAMYRDHDAQASF